MISSGRGGGVYEQLRRRCSGAGLKETVPPTADCTVLGQGYAGANNPFGGSDAMIRPGKLR